MSNLSNVRVLHPQLWERSWLTPAPEGDEFDGCLWLYAWEHSWDIRLIVRVLTGIQRIFSRARSEAPCGVRTVGIREKLENDVRSRDAPHLRHLETHRSPTKITPSRSPIVVLVLF